MYKVWINTIFMKNVPQKNDFSPISKIGPDIYVVAFK